MNDNMVLEKRLVLKKGIRIFLSKLMISIIILLSVMVLIKNNILDRKILIEKVYSDNIKFLKIRNIYSKYFGNYFFNMRDELPVFSEKLKYNDSIKYKDGVLLSVDNNMMVPSFDNGIVVYIGVKDGLGNTVVVEQADGVDVFYSSINTSNLKLYDYISKGDFIGSPIDGKIILTFQKDGKVLDYNKYI